MPIDVVPLADLVRKHGKNRGAQLLVNIGKRLRFEEALSHPVGVQLLADITAMWEERVEKVVNLTATDEEKLEFRICHVLLCRWATRLQELLDLEQKASGGAK